MKYIISFFLFFQSMNSFGQHNSIIVIKHIGISDKPIPTIVVCTKDVCNTPCIYSIVDTNKVGTLLNKIVASPNLINVLFQSLQQDDNVPSNPNQKTYMFGSFEIDYLNNKCQKEAMSFLCDRKKNVDLFKLSIKKISALEKEENTELIQALTNLVKRIEY